MTTKIKSYQKLLILIFTALVLSNCEKEEIVTEHLNSIETVSVEEALNLFSQNSEKNQFSKTTSDQFVIPHLDAISQEEIINSDELLTVIPATTYAGVYSRILVIKINDDIKSVVFSMVSDEPSNTEEFSGMIYINTLNKEYVNTFKVKNGIIVSRFKAPTDANSAKGTFSKTDPDCVGITCGMQGEEVVITVTKSNKQFEFEWIFNDEGGNDAGGGSGYNGESWNSGGAGGGTNNDQDDNTCPQGYVRDINNECIIITCPEGYIKDDNGMCVINPLLGADCSSFEYSQPPGALVKGCAVTNFGNNFYYGFFRSDGTWEAGYFPTNIPLIYFTMPPHFTNGQAANLTAEAVTAAIRVTDAYVFANAQRLTEADVRSQFSTNLKNAMRLVGGSIQNTAPFSIRSPAPYLASLLGAKTDCD